MLGTLLEVCNSTIKGLEIFYVLHNSKPASRILCHEMQLESVVLVLDKMGLVYEMSDFKVQKDFSSKYYSDTSYKIPLDDSRVGYVIVYIATTRSLAKKIKRFEEDEDHFSLGGALGYPSCCCTFFDKYFSPTNTDLTLHALPDHSRQSFPWEMNIAARHFDCSLLSHFPHQFDCAESLAIARNNFSLVQKHSSQLAEAMRHTMQSVVIYSDEHGVIILKDLAKDANSFSYKNVLSTTPSKLYFLLESEDHIEITNSNAFVIGSEEIHDENLTLIDFTDGML